jgi:hypothetical protein
MRKSRPESVRHENTDRERNALRHVPQPGRRRLALDAENAKVNAQVGVRISWIH